MSIPVDCQLLCSATPVTTASMACHPANVPVTTLSLLLQRLLLYRVLDMFKKQSTKPYDRQAVLGILPFELKAKILRHLYAGAIRDVPLLRNIADDDLFMTDMCIRLQPYTCSANTFVYQRGELWSWQLL